MTRRTKGPRWRGIIILALAAAVILTTSLVIAKTHVITADATPGRASSYPALVLKGVLTKRIPWAKLPTPVSYNGRKDPDNRHEQLQGLYKGQTLYNLIGLVDDRNPKTFNVAKARRGYGIKLIATDGYTWVVPSAKIIGKKDWIIAKLKDGKPLPTWEGPYRHVGASFIGFRAGQSVRLLVRIELVPK